MTRPNYPPPLDQLLRLGTIISRPRVNYAALGLTLDQVPDLIRMATDEALHLAENEAAAWAPVHALRALADLRAVAAVEPLLPWLDMDDDFFPGELATALGQIGPAALAPLAAYLRARLHDLWGRISAGQAIETMGTRFPEARAECVRVLAQQLEQAAVEDPGFNGWLVASLLELKAVEAAPVIAAAFKTGRVDLAVTGDWEDAQVELGLLPRRRTPRPNYLMAKLNLEQPRPKSGRKRRKKKST